MIACLNVIDRCDAPRSLLEALTRAVALAENELEALGLSVRAISRAPYVSRGLRVAPCTSSTT